MSAAAVLEGRYRRLLRMYPAEHRRKHQDEMLGVLMTGARAGQHRPGPADTANLIWGALLIRLRPARPGTAWPLWRDALAVVSVLLPLAFLAYRDLLGQQPADHAAGETHAVFARSCRYDARQRSAAWALLTALVLLRLRRTAVLATTGLLIWFLVATAGAPYWVGHRSRCHADRRRHSGWSLPRCWPRRARGRAMPLMTWRYYALAVLVPVGLACRLQLGWWLPHPLLANATMITLVAITLAGMARGHTAGRRVAPRLSIPALLPRRVGYLVPPSMIGGPYGSHRGGRDRCGSR